MVKAEFGIIHTIEPHLLPHLVPHVLNGDSRHGLHVVISHPNQYSVDALVLASNN